MMTELTNLAQHWFAFSVVLATQLLLVLALRNPVRAHLGAVACYRLWLLPLAWLPLYFLGPLLFATLATPDPASGAQGGAAPYRQALQQFVEIELLPFDLQNVGGTTLAAGGDTTFQGWSVLAVIWAAGTAALIAWHGRRWLIFSREVRTLSAPLTSAEKEHVGTPAHFAPQVPVLRLQGMQGAALFGVFKPALLLPESFSERYDSGQRHIILAHESVHLRRGDNGWNLCALMLITLFWINPLTFVAWRYFRLDQELSCDALALARCNRDQQKRYARTLLHSLGSLSSYNTPPALSAWDNLRDIKERSLMVHRHLHAANRPIATLCSLFALAALGASLTIACAELVSPVARAAEPAAQMRDVEQAVRETRQATQQAQRSLLETRLVTQQTQQTVQGAQAAAQEAQRALLETQREAQAAQRALQETQQALQQDQRALMETQREAQEAQRALQETRQALQETQRALEEAQRAAQEGQLDIQDAQPPAQEPDGQQTTGVVLSEAIALLNSDRFAEARQRLESLDLASLSPYERSRLHQVLFNLEMVDQDYPGAREQLQFAIDSGGLNVQEISQMRYQIAQLYIQEERYAEGAAAMEAWILAEAEPASSAYYLLAAAYYYQNMLDAALPNAQRAVDLAGDSPNQAWLALLSAISAQLEVAADAEPMTTGFAPELVPVARVSPSYPRRALALGVEGWVKVRFTVSETGEVVDAVVVDSSPKAVFDNAAISAVSRWRYNPPVEDSAATQNAGVETMFRFMLADAN